MTLDEIATLASREVAGTHLLTYGDYRKLARAVEAMLPLCRDAVRLYDRAEKCQDNPYLGCPMDHSDVESALNDGVEGFRELEKALQ